MESDIEQCEVMRYPCWFSFHPYNQHIFGLKNVNNPRSTWRLAPRAGYDLGLDEKTSEIIVYAKIGETGGENTHKR